MLMGRETAQHTRLSRRTRPSEKGFTVLLFWRPRISHALFVVVDAVFIICKVTSCCGLHCAIFSSSLRPKYYSKGLILISPSSWSMCSPLVVQVHASCPACPLARAASTSLHPGQLQRGLVHSTGPDQGRPPHDDLDR